MNSMTPTSFSNNGGAARHPRPTFYNKRYQRGASLLEGIAYLGIAAIVVLGAVSLLTGAFSSAKSNQATEETVALRTAVRKLYIGQAYPVDNLISSLLLANAVPNTIARPSATTLGNSWGGSVSVAGTATGFTITYTLVPKDVCVNVVSGANGWTSVGTTDANGISVFPLTVADATTLCTGDTNTLIFKAA